LLPQQLTWTSRLCRQQQQQQQQQTGQFKEEEEGKLLVCARVSIGW
jgi:hypothetical protein